MSKEWGTLPGEGWVRGADGVYRRDPSARRVPRPDSRRQNGQLPLTTRSEPLVGPVHEVSAPLQPHGVARWGLLASWGFLLAVAVGGMMASEHTPSSQKPAEERGVSDYAADSHSSPEAYARTPTSTPSAAPPSDHPPALDAAVELFIRKGLVLAGTPYGTCPSGTPQRWWIGQPENCWANTLVPPPAPTWSPPPTAPPRLGGTVCADGWISGSTGRGTCSHHGGMSR